jgi:DNA-binding LacI/PurR family transcriptional regulator
MNKIITSNNNVPLFLQIKEYIFELLKSMNLKSGDKIPSENDFCHKSNVSIRTVRRALTELEKDGVIVRRQGQGSFLLDINANARPDSMGTIGILFSDMNYVIRPVFSKLLQAIEAQVLEHGYSFHLYSTGDRLSPKGERPLEQIVPLDNVKGLIATSALSEDDIQTLRRNKIPLVAFNEYNNIQLNSVIFDYYSAAKIGIKYLVKTGRKNISFICRHFSEAGSPAVFNNDNFLRGIKDAFAENNLVFNKNMVFQSDTMRKDGRKIADELFKSTNPPDAIFTVNELLAQGASDVIKENNFDCDLISCGMPSESENISSIEIPAKEWGETAIDLLFRNIKGDSSVKKTKLIKAELKVTEN